MKGTGWGSTPPGAFAFSPRSGGAVLPGLTVPVE